MTIPVPLRSRPAALLLLVLCWGAAITTAANGQEAEAAESPALTTGDAAPGFELPTFDDGQVSLRQYLGEDGKSVVLIFARAHW